MRKALHHPVSGAQGTRRVVEFAIEFDTLAAESEWDQRVLKAAFHRPYQVVGTLLSGKQG